MTAGVTAAPAQSRAVPVALLVWFVAALALGPTLFSLAFPAPQLAIIAITVLAAVGLRKWLAALPWRALVGLHAIRLVGVVWVILGARGLLAPEFASRAGWGDIIAALGAIGLALAGLRSKGLAHLWNSFGALDLVVAVGTATLVAIAGSTPGIEPLTHLPFNLVPTFFVPLLMASHVAIFRRLNAA